MAEISPIAVKRLARLRPDFLTMTPEAVEAFIVQIRQRRSNPLALKKVQNVKKTSKVKAVKALEIQSQAPGSAETPPGADT